MSPRLPPGAMVATVQIPIPLGAITMVAPPPALISPDVGAAHVGLDRAGLVEHFAWMRRSPRWRDAVIELSRKRRLATPADVIASLRERASARPAVDTAPADDDGVAELYEELGLEAVPPAPTRRRRRS